jgi:hypothetical protein
MFDFADLPNNIPRIKVNPKSNPTDVTKAKSASINP